MPINPIGVASAGIDLIGGIYNAISSHNTNIKNRDFAKEMYAKQRADALSDWERQNLYNSPEQQMARFRAAGLNPNLIYGNQTQTASVRSTSQDVPKGEAPQFHGSPLSAYQDYAMKNVQTNMVKQQTENAQQQNLLIQAQIVNTLMNADKTALTNQFLRDNWETALSTNLKRLEVLQTQAAQGWQTLEQKDKLFPIQIANLIATGKKTESGTALDYSNIEKNKSQIRVNAKQIAKMGQEITKMASETDLIKLKSFDQNKRNGFLDDIHQGIIINNNLKSGQTSKMEAEKQLLEIKTKWRGAGLSETFISDLFGLITRKK